MVIQTQRLTKSYGGRRGIIDVNLTVNEGEIFGFLGPNGAGKSTTIRLLLGFLRATSGSASILGQDCWQGSHKIKRDVGYVPGDVRLYPWLTANRAFRIVGEIRGRDISRRADELAERFRLERDLPVRKMSRGNRQKLSLVMALAHDPKLVVLDEPTSGLDPLMQTTLSDCLHEMAAAGKTVFFSSHTLSEVETLCDRVAIVRDGTIVVDERLQDLKAVAPRSATLTFDSEEAASQASFPDSVQLERRRRNECDVTVSGSSCEFAKWATSQPVSDISISAPNLEVLFRSYYKTNANEES